MHIHFIGSEGVSMRWIASYYRNKGWEISGSDIATGGHRAENVEGADLVVYTSAAAKDNPELLRAQELGIPILPRAEALGRICGEFTSSIAVAGTHGKTTTTAMLASILDAYRPAVHVGGTVGGQQGSTTGDILIAEACEYCRNFLHIRPELAVILNVELDHTDCYKTYSSLIAAFARFAAQSRAVVIPDAFAPFFKPRIGGRQTTVGARGDYSLMDYKPDREGGNVSFKTPDGILRARLNVLGKHNATNATYAVAASAEFGADAAEIRQGLENFAGVDRRLQRVGTTRGTPVVSDYAHHPTEIAASLEALRSAGYVRPLVVFQPHTYERLASLLRNFTYALLGVTSIVLPVFAARGDVGSVTSRDLAHGIVLRGGKSVAAEDFDRAAELVLSAASRHDAIVVMGAGDNEKILPLILDRNCGLKKNE